MITVVTVVFNRVEGIERTILSVLNQSYKKVQYVVIDGGSTDGTVNIIEKYSARIAHWVSESDRGIYDAMNKGVRVASGDWVLFLNAGDFLFENALEEFSKCLNSGCDVYYGNIEIVNHSKSRILRPSPLKELRYRMPFCHQAVLTRRHLITQYPFSDDYKLAADFDFFRRIYLANYKFRYIEITVAFYDLSGVSYLNYSTYMRESWKVLKRNSRLTDLVADTTGFLKVNYKFLAKRALVRMHNVIKNKNKHLSCLAS